MTSNGPPARAFEEYSREVYGWAYRLLGRHHDALDVVQEVFLRWNRQWAEGAPAQPRGWLRRVTVNRAIDTRRSRRPDSDHAASPAVRSMPASDRAGEAIDRDMLRGDIAAAFARLTDIQRGVLVAKVYDELTFAKIAAEHELSVSTVKTHYLRAIRVVRDKLRGRWGDED